MTARRIIKNIDFGPIWGMSGVQNFFGEGFPFHKICRNLFPTRFTFQGVTFVAKTTTLFPRAGNMPTKKDGITPRERKPTCIILGPWQFLTGVMLNAVGLSGPGTKDLLSRGQWQERARPFMISFMSIEDTVPARLKEFDIFLRLLAAEIPNFHASLGLQINLSCPNVKAGGKSDATLLEEGFGYLELMARCLPRIPIIFKLNVSVHPKTAVELSVHPQCGGVCISNTLPWATLKQWKRMVYFPSSIFTGKSPLDRFDGGGLSGKPLLSLVERWVQEAREAGFSEHINAGGGILSADDVNRLKKAGADSVSIGSVAALRPWRLHSIIEQAHKVCL